MTWHRKAIVAIAAALTALAVPAVADAALTVPHVAKPQVIVPTAPAPSSGSSGGGSQSTSTPTAPTAPTAPPPAQAAPPAQAVPTPSDSADAPTAASAEPNSDLPPVPSTPVDPASSPGEIANQAGSLGVNDLGASADDQGDGQGGEDQGADQSGAAPVWDDDVIGIDLSGPDDWTGQVHSTNPPNPDLDAAIQQAIDFANILTSGHSEPPDPLTFPNHEPPEGGPTSDNSSWACPSLNVFQIDEHIEDDFDNMGCF